MKITVTGINTDEAVLVRGTSAFGFRGTFGCPLVVGEAIFIPARGRERELRPGSTLSMEVSFESVAQLRVITALELADSMSPLAESCAYLVTGKVVAVAPLGNVCVSVRGLIFTLSRDELEGLNPENGQTLQFSVQGLTFWDAVV